METLCTLSGNSKLTWSDHCKKIASKAIKLLNVLCRTMFDCSILAKNVAYKSIVRPSMEYACAVWNPHTEKDCALLDAVQNRAARWVLKSRWDPESLRWTKSSSDCVSTLNWPSLSTRRIYFIIMFFSMFTMDILYLPLKTTYYLIFDTLEVTSLLFKQFLLPLILIDFHWW